MTIREVETLSGMTRANIRFYEHEGLLTPVRTDNDYRHYSEEDLASLLKIKLLRQLQVPIEDIKKLQSGTLELSAALDEKLQQLERDMKDLQSSIDICRDIRANSYRYEDLDAQKYLSWIGTAEPGRSTYFTVPSDEMPKVKHPWRRYLARSLDMTVYSIVWAAVSMLVLRWPTPGGLLLQLLESYVVFGLMLFIEPILLATLGTTPGKWIFGLQVRDTDGRKLTYSEGLIRTWGVFHYGYGFLIPIYSLYRHYKSYKICVDTGELQWDEDFSYAIRDTKIYRAAAYIGATLLALGLMFLIVLQAEMPRHRGDLTAVEFTQNMNDLMHYQKLNSHKYLDASGKWTEDSYDSGMINLTLFSLPLPDFKITETDGIVTKVTFEVTSNTQDIIMDTFTNLIVLAAKSYVGAQKDYNVFTQFSVISPQDRAFTNFEFTKAGITVKNSVTYGGYQLFTQDYLTPVSGEEQNFHLVFSMEKTG